MPETRTRERLRLVSRQEACEALGCCVGTFRNRWHTIFSDPRDPDERKSGKPRKVRSDELDVALNDGRLAVLAFRRLKGRTR